MEGTLIDSLLSGLRYAIDGAVPWRDRRSGRGGVFWRSSPEAWGPLLCLLLTVAPENARWFGEVRLGVAFNLTMFLDGDSG